MHESTCSSYTTAPPGRAPSDAETLARQAFQAVHPEVGFAFRRGQEPPWAAYWLAADGERKHVTGATLTEVLDGLAGEFR